MSSINWHRYQIVIACNQRKTHLHR